ncbi:hypothetical protein HanXRQr2_Chr17g0797671 [Helianthus annuus]|uniref:Uncharacterized protein n=1 Tax=Helianthus annuus TaxID=4232 RepID=A0A9K3DIR7_HELAN|nr:hypothetical protein HanXRQr2_Chr17g0797671 [Helianthus annuus]KAJ0812749.1 hypothetical protein HanPSC8_Chr17g0765441 [Helianthus annuus]
MIAVIVREFHQWQVFVPTTTKIYNTRSEHVFKSTDRSFSLSVGLRVECSTQIKRRTKGRLKHFPQLRSEPSVAV